MKGFNR